MTDQSTPDPNRLDNLRSETDRKTKPINSRIDQDPDYIKMLELYQNAEFRRCQNFINELERRYPGHAELKKIKEDLDFKLSLKDMSAQQKKEETKEKAKSTIKLVLFAIFGFVIVAAALLISYFHFSGQVTEDENVQKTAQSISLGKLFAQAEELLLFGQPQPAQEIIERIKTIDPDFENLEDLEARAEDLSLLEAKYQQGVELQNEGKFDEALIIFNEINDEEEGLWDINQRIDQIMTSMDIEKFLAEGYDAYLAEDWDKVVSAYEAAMLLDPSIENQQIDERLFQAYLNKIINLLQYGTSTIEDIENADLYYRKANLLLPQNADYSEERKNLEEVSTALLKVKYLQIAGELLADKAQTTTTIGYAVTYINRAADFDPSDSDLQENLNIAKHYEAAFRQFVGKEYDSAINNLTPVISSDPDYADGNARLLLYESYFFLGEQYYSARLYEDAIKTLEQAEIFIWDDPNNLFRLYKLQILLGDVHAEAENYEDSVSYYRYALNAINLGSRLAGHPDVLEKYAEANIAADYRRFETANESYKAVIDALDFIYNMTEVEIEKGVCLALFAGEYNSTVDAILEANDLPENMVINVERTLIVPTIKE